MRCRHGLTPPTCAICTPMRPYARGFAIARADKPSARIRDRADRERLKLEGRGFAADLDNLSEGPKATIVRTETARTMAELAGLMRTILGIEILPWQEALLEAWEAEPPPEYLGLAFANVPGPGKASFCRALERALKHKSARPAAPGGSR